MILSSNKNKTFQKVKPIVIGISSNQEPIILTGKTRGILDSDYNKAVARLYTEYSLPKREKAVVELNSVERELFNIRNEDDRKTNMIVCWDETSAKYIEKKAELERMQLLIFLVSYLKLDEVCIEEPSGKLISHYEDFGINPNTDLFDLALWFHSELKITDHDVSEYFTKEVEQLKAGNKTIAELYLEGQQSNNESEV